MQPLLNDIESLILACDNSHDTYKLADNIERLIKCSGRLIQEYYRDPADQTDAYDMYMFRIEDFLYGLDDGLKALRDYALKCARSFEEDEQEERECGSYQDDVSFTYFSGRKL